MEKPLLLTKTAASRWLNVAPQTLASYLARGKIEAHSLVGEGVRARLDIRRAVRDLKQNLDEEYLERPGRRVRLSLHPPKHWETWNRPVP
jgi:hypothetical protein